MAPNYTKKKRGESSPFLNTAVCRAFSLIKKAWVVTTEGVEAVTGVKDPIKKFEFKKKQC